MMFCVHCGQELQDGAKFCSACGQALEKQAEAQTACEHLEEETVVIETSAMCYWNGKPESGSVTLTNRRFLFEGKHDPSTAKRFLLGPFLSMMGREEYKIELTGSDIADVREGKCCGAKTIAIVTQSGEEHHFVLGGMKKNSWLIELQNLMKRTSSQRS